MRPLPAKIRTICQRGRLWLLLMLSAALLCLWGWGLSPASQAAVVALIPLDSRPVNTDLPQQLAKIGGVDVILPTDAFQDQFLRASDSAGLMGWLNVQAPQADLLILHLNELLFGGLIQSRDDMQYLDAKQKLSDLHSFLDDPEVRSKKIVLIYILPRLLPSQYDPSMWEYEASLTAYSQLKHQLADAPGDPDLVQALDQQINRIPREILDRYDALFSQAKATGSTLLDWADQGLADEVVIGLDDAASFGLNVQTFQSLQRASEAQDQSQVYFLHGADELASLVIMRHTSTLRGPESFQPVFITPQDAKAIPHYESISLQDNFAEKRHYLYAPTVKDASLPPVQRFSHWLKGLFSFADPAPRLKYAVLHTQSDLAGPEIDQAWQQIAALRGNTVDAALVGLADTAKINGASKAFIDTVGVASVYTYVDAYAGWNTAGNSLGTVMAHLLFLEKGQALKGPGRSAALASHRSLQRLRLIDDYIFQSQVREEFVKWSLGQGFSYLTFGNRWAEANEKLQTMMEKALSAYPELLPEISNLSESGASADRFTFPWPRSFELQIESSETGIVGFGH
ncbi:MAG TPA: hypothetical protein DIT32_00790 [Peptococcaceae bacterium]|nr:hypothetical protein [Peptococcaceae bacterium]